MSVVSEAETMGGREFVRQWHSRMILRSVAQLHVVDLQVVWLMVLFKNQLVLVVRI